MVDQRFQLEETAFVSFNVTEKTNLGILGAILKQNNKQAFMSLNWVPLVG